MSRVDYYRSFDSAESDKHPIDVAVDLRLDHVDLRRHIRALRAEIALRVSHGPLWLDLEDAEARERVERERAYFNLAYELGRADGNAEILAQLHDVGSTPAAKLFARKVRHALGLAGLPPHQVRLLLLQALMSIGEPPGVVVPTPLQWAEALVGDATQTRHAYAGRAEATPRREGAW